MLLCARPPPVDAVEKEPTTVLSFVIAEDSFLWESILGLASNAPASGFDLRVKLCVCGLGFH
jgi:hypothetical protein